MMRAENMGSHLQVKDVIAKYAQVYKEFEKLQQIEFNRNPILASGDQKTGVVAEYYAKLYIEQNEGKGQVIVYEAPGASHDLQYLEEGNAIRVQVKTVSAHSKTRTISPIKLKYKKEGKLSRAFDKLYLISLNENFVPDGFWINDFEAIEMKILANPEKTNNKDESKRWKIEGAFMQGGGLHPRISRGSGYLDFSTNLNIKLLEALKKVTR